MFVSLSKILPQLVYPLGLTCLFLLLAVIFGKSKRFFQSVIGICVVLLFVGGNRFVADALTRSLESKYSPITTEVHSEIIVVLGGATESSDSPRQTVEINGAGDRVIYAARLYKQGAAPTVLLSGGYIEWLRERSTTPAEEMKELMVFFGVPEEALILQPKSQNTYEDALYSTEICKSLGISQVILVTSAQHMPRSVALFENQGLTVIPAPTDYVVTEARWNQYSNGNFLSFLANFWPTSGSLSQITNSLHEYLGILMYKLQGWL
mgnify:CR=1 FL=1